MSVLKTSLTLTIVIGALIAPVAASAGMFHHHRHPVCGWQSRHHHRVRVCR